MAAGRPARGPGWHRGCQPDRSAV